MIAAMLAWAVQTNDGPMKLSAAPVPDAKTADFSAEGAADLPDGVRFRVVAYYGGVLPTRRVAATVFAVQKEKFAFRLTADGIPPLAGEYVLVVEPDRQQPEDLPTAVSRDLPNWAGRWTVRIGTEEEAAKVERRVRTDLARDLERVQQAAERVKMAAADADWKTIRADVERDLAAVVRNIESNRALDLFDLRAIASNAAEDLPAAVLAYLAAVERSQTAGADEAWSRLDRGMTHYLSLVRADARNRERALAAIEAIRAAVAPEAPRNQGVPAAVQQHLVELGWQTTADAHAVSELAALVQRYFAGEEVRASIEAILTNLQRTVSNP